MVAKIGDENLSFGLQASERFAVNYAVAVALKWKACGVFNLFVYTPQAL